MNRLFWILFSAVMLLMPAFAQEGRPSAPVKHPVPAYRVTDLGQAYPQVFGCSPFANPWVINDRDEVVGASSLWTRDLQVVGLSQQFGQPTFACAINDAGQFAGSFYDDNVLIRRPFLFTPNAGVLELKKLPGGDRSEVYALNRQGEAVGYSNTAPGSVDFHATLWNRAGIQDLAPAAHNCQALGINNSGVVVGYCNQHAFLWAPKVGMQDLGNLAGGSFSAASAINDREQVVGFSMDSNSVRAFLWSRSGGMQDMGAQWFPVAINNSGYVVGCSVASSDGSPFPASSAILFASKIGTIDLNTAVSSQSGFELACASSINRRGQIVVYALGRSDLYMHLVLLSPVRTEGSD
jgi:probable HAF family extracellular repeat protein